MIQCSTEAVLVGECVVGSNNMYPPPQKPHSMSGERYEPLDVWETPGSSRVVLVGANVAMLKGEKTTTATRGIFLVFFWDGGTDGCPGLGLLVSMVIGWMVVISPTYKWDVLGLQPTDPIAFDPSTSGTRDIPKSPRRPFIELAVGKDVILLVGIYDQQFQGTLIFNGLWLAGYWFNKVWSSHITPHWYS